MGSKKNNENNTNQSLFSTILNIPRLYNCRVSTIHTGMRRFCFDYPQLRLKLLKINRFTFNQPPKESHSINHKNVQKQCMSIA